MRAGAVVGVVAVATLAGGVLFASSNDESTSTPVTTVAATTSVPATTSTSTTSTTTSTSTTTTVYTGPPTLAPGDTLPIPDPPPAEGHVDPDVLIGTIEIPRLMLAMEMHEGVTKPTLDRGIGWWPGTALPGDPGNVVLGGHRTSKQKPFRYLDLLEPGDEIIFTTPEGRFVYLVDRTEIVTPDALWIVDQTTDATATLFACHPPGSVKQRIVVFAKYASKMEA